jgi:hypothetical protein
MNGNYFGLLAAVPLMLFAAPLETSQPTGPTRADIVNSFRHYEGAVRSVYCEFERIVPETPPAQMQLIRSVKGKDAERAIITRDLARGMSVSIKFWHQGIKQREEGSPLDPELAKAGPNITAFDGQIVRSFGSSSNGLVAAVSTAENASWNALPRHDPIAFLFLYYDIPFSQVVADSPAFSVSPLDLGGEHCHRVSLEGTGRLTGQKFDFILNSRLLQVRRTTTMPTGPGFHWSNSTQFLDYKEHVTASGETVWFPGRIVFTINNGLLPNGEPLEVRREEFPIKLIRFNEPMPDSLFELDIPREASVNDRVTNLGWLPPGVRPAALFPAEARARRWWTAGAVAVACAAIGFGVWYARRIRRARLERAGGSP